MIKVNGIIESIDTSKMETDYVYFYDMCENEFQIYEYLEQPKGNNRLTYCNYNTWICTDTEVGIRVWYFDNEPVCISWKPYRKSDETFGWLSKEKFDIVRNYALSLRDENFDYIIVDDETINNVVKEFNSIEYKKFEKLNVISL